MTDLFHLQEQTAAEMPAYSMRAVSAADIRV